MKHQYENDYGTTTIDNDVIAKHAGMAAVNCFGVVGMAAVNMKDGIVKLLTNQNLTKGVKIFKTDPDIELELHIIVAYGVSISTVCSNLIHSVKYSIEEFVGIEVSNVHVFVEKVKVIDE